MMDDSNSTAKVDMEVLSKTGKNLAIAIATLSSARICVIHPEEYRILFCNNALNEQSVCGKKCYEVFHDSSVPCWMNGSRCPLQRVKATGSSTIVNHSHYTADGTLELMEVESIPVFNNDGELALVVQRSSSPENGRAGSVLESSRSMTGISGIRALSGLSLRLLESRSLSKALSGGTDEIRKALDVSRAYVGKLSSQSGRAYTVMASSEDQSEIGPDSYNKPDQSLAGALPEFITEQLQRGEGYYGNTCDLPPDDSHILTRRGVTAIAAVPIQTDGELWGYLGIETTGRPRDWNKSETRIIQAASRMLASAIEKWNALDSLTKSLDKTKRAFAGISEALSFTLEKRDPYTAGHQKRVVHIATAICDHLGVNGSTLECIQVSALLHDIGKIRIPIDILNRPASLSELECSFIRNHAQEGYEILNTVNFPWPVAEVVLEHHERYDGSGYPKGLSGSEIMFESYILGLADVVEAMTSHRPYRPALSRAEMEEEVIENRGVLYEPSVVDALLEYMKEEGMSWKKIGDDG